MDNTLQNTLHLRYQAETALYRLNRRKQTLGEEIAQARYDQRLANAAAAEYKGSLQSFFHRFSGKQASRAEELAREKRAADARLEALLREQEILRKTYTETADELNRLPTREELLSRAGDDPAFTAQFHRLEGRFLAEQLLPLLDENYDALLAFRDLLQGNRMGEIMSHEQRQSICTLPDTTGKACAELLARLEEAMAGLNQPFGVPDYYRAPVAYINAVASDALRRDRINQALDQVLDVKKQVSRLRETLDD